MSPSNHMAVTDQNSYPQIFLWEIQSTLGAQSAIQFMKIFVCNTHSETDLQKIKLLAQLVMVGGTLHSLSHFSLRRT